MSSNKSQELLTAIDMSRIDCSSILVWLFKTQDQIFIARLTRSPEHIQDASSRHFTSHNIRIEAIDEISWSYSMKKVGKVQHLPISDSCGVSGKGECDG